MPVKSMHEVKNIQNYNTNLLQVEALWAISSLQASVAEGPRWQRIAHEPNNRSFVLLTFAPYRCCEHSALVSPARGWLLSHPVAFSVCCCARLHLNNHPLGESCGLRRLCVGAISCYSPFLFSRPCSIKFRNSQHGLF